MLRMNSYQRGILVIIVRELAAISTTVCQIDDLIKKNVLDLLTL